MHPEAHDAVRRAARALNLDVDPLRILDAGGRDVNGNVRDCFHPDSTWTVVDRLPGEGVNVVANLVTWLPQHRWDVVVCCEVFEHDRYWPDILATCLHALKPGGALIVTCATDPRAPHSGIDGEEVREGEWYGNVDPDELMDCVKDKLEAIVSQVHPRGDLYLRGRKKT